MSKKGGHHGGAWKVAYADFVTAMMALFMVLWLAAQDQKIKEAVERAFRHPFMSLTKESAGLMPNINKNTGSSSQSGKYENATATVMELSMLRRLEEDLMKSLAKRVEQEDESVKMTLTPEGLRISIFDRGNKPVFESHSSKLTEYGAWILSALAWDISRYTNFMLEVEGHTERGNVVANERYGPWELTADRANSGRRKLIENGVTVAQIRKVAGFADTAPLPGQAPDSPLNRRIALILKVDNENKTR